MEQERISLYNGLTEPEKISLRQWSIKEANSLRPHNDANELIKNADLIYNYVVNGNEKKES